MNILVLCTGNSARSILLEAIFNKIGEGRVCAFSAGSKPVGDVNPASIQLLKSLNIPTDGFSSKSWDIFAEPDAPQMGLVITVCGNARDETCPFWPGAPVRAHWGVEDPADVTEPETAVREAFQNAYDILFQRAEALMKLDFETLSPQEFQKQVNKIGLLTP